MRCFSVLIPLVFVLLAEGAATQTVDAPVWVQIEARPSLEVARDRAEVYAETLPDVASFALPGGWYAIALGPFTQADAETVIQSYRGRGIIPFDSYIAFSATYGDQVWPPGAVQSESTATTELRTELPSDSAQARTSTDAPRATTAPGLREDTETPAAARRSERLLTAAERRELQTALRWAGVYNAAIDGAFGRGTRSAMADWQRRNGLDPTGVLTTAQRAVLLQQYTAILDGLGMQRVRSPETGIEIAMPTVVVGFSRVEAPFAHYEATGSSPARVLLISQEGDSGTLRSLYDVMQTLDIVPLEGTRVLRRDSFTILGRNAQIVSETHVDLEAGAIKGFTLVWPADDEARRSRLVQDMRASFTRLPGTLDPAAGVSDAQRIDLFAGLDLRQPTRARSGFFVDETGAVVTTAEAVAGCTRITLDGRHDARLTRVDAERGVAVVTPERSLAPPQVARFTTLPPRLQSDVAVAGYSFEGQLDAPSVTFGALSDVRGLRGEANLRRLALSTLPGDSGGPVFDASGNVFGMLLPKSEGARQLPEDVRFALTSEVIVEVLRASGLRTREAESRGDLDPIALADLGLGMTVLVECWE